MNVNTKYSGNVSWEFTSSGDIRMALANLDVEVLTKALVALRNQLTIRTNDGAITPQDPRLLLAKSWFDMSPRATDIFSIMDRTPRPSATLTALCISILSSVLTLFSSHLVYHPIGEPIVKSLLSPSRMRQLNLNLASTSSELILSTLKLFNAMSTYAGKSYQKSVLEGFSWGQKSLQKLLFLRKKSKAAHELDLKSKPDIRTLFIFFILSFLSSSTATPIKLSMLEQHREIFLLIFKGISQDTYTVAHRILEVCWVCIWNDPKIKRSLKIGLFSEHTINHLLKLYNRDSPEDDIPEHVPADLVHHFMLALTTRPGVGICFRDRGWYPREHSLEDGVIRSADAEGDDADLSTTQGGKINNKILANVIKGLKVNEDPRQQELVLKILEACPELVAGYWGAVNLTLEPRLSSRWITNIGVFGMIISLPIPTHSFLLPHSMQLNPSPPPLSSTLSNVFPSVLTKNHLTKGLQSSSRLVQHCTALALSKCLTRLQNVLTVFREAARQLEEDGEAGQWSRCCRQLETEVERRVPDSMVIIAMVQQKHPDEDRAKTGLLIESALRLLWLYQRMFPRLIAEVRFDVGKLLLSVTNQNSSTPLEDSGADADNTSSIHDGQSGMDVLRQLHVLRLLRDSEQFSWTSKSAPSSHSHLHIILTLYTRTPHPAVRAATSELLSHLLSSSILFSHDPAELIFWLESLPFTRRAPSATTPDGTALSDESTGVLNFLDDCINRCIKTPYRYLEESISFFSGMSSGDFSSKDTLHTHDDPSEAPSPLLMTLFEQLLAKVTANLVSLSDTLAIVTFMRKLIYSMTRKQSDLRSARKLGERLQDICSLRSVPPRAAIIQGSIKRECELLSNILDFIEDPITQNHVDNNPAVQQFLEQVEKFPIPSSPGDRSHSAYELVDWTRLIHPGFHPDDTKRLVLAVLRFSPSAITEFLNQLDPLQGHLWYSIEDNIEQLEIQVPFDLAYLHATPSQLARNTTKDCLATFFFSQAGGGELFERKLSVVMHRLTARMKRRERVISHPEISLLTSILNRAHSRCTESNMELLKKVIFAQSKPIRELCCSPDLSSTDLEELSALVGVGLDPQSKSDKSLAHEYCAHWVAYLNTTNDLRSCVLASPWVAFMDAPDVIRYLDVIISAVQGGSQLSDADSSAAVRILDTLARFRTTPVFLKDMRHRLRGLLDLRQYLDRNPTLEALLLLIVEAGLALGYNALPLAMTIPFTISDVSLAAQERWKSCATRLPLHSDLTAELLRSEDWTEITSRMISGALYQSFAARRTFSAWLAQNEPHDGSSVGIIAIALHGFLDVTLRQGKGPVAHFPDPWFLALLRHLIQGQDSFEALELCAACIRMVLEISPSGRAHYANHMVDQTQGTTINIINLPFLLLAHDLFRIDATAFSTILGTFSDEALRWLAGLFSEGVQTETDLSLAEELTSVISRWESNAHLVEPVLNAAIQSCFHVPKVVQSIIPLVSSTPLKPAVVNRMLQRIIQHSQLYRLADSPVPTREPIIRLLHKLFHLHPANTCQPSHVVPLTRLYGGTLSLSDRLLFSIFHLYEKQRKASMASMFRRGSPSGAGSASQDALDAITGLDPSRVFRTCTAFPTRRRLDAAVVVEADHAGEEGEYDPVFLVLLVAQLLAEHTELSTPDWVQLFRTNAVCAVMCVLTSRDEALRQVGVSTLGGVLRRVQDADFLEKDQVVYIMNMLQDILPPPSSVHPTPAPRLPTHPVMVLAHALRSTFYPSSFIYPVISRFLLQRPELDITDVPMLYSLLYSSADGGGWVRERTWMIRFLADAMREGGARDWAVLRRRHTWDLVASMWQAAGRDETSVRHGVLEFLANISANSHAVTALVLRSALLSWIELQLQTRTAQEAEHVAFVKILENVLVTADVDKAHRATQGEFSAAVARCLCIILRGITPSDSLCLLALISRVVLRMAAQPPLNTVALSEVLTRAVGVLRRIEPSVAWTAAARARLSPNAASLPQPPHHARGLFDLSVPGEGTALWGECVQSLWRVSMSLGAWRGDRECWGALSCRLLVVRASSAHCVVREGDVGEWGRRQTVGCLLGSETEE